MKQVKQLLKIAEQLNKYADKLQKITEELIGAAPKAKKKRGKKKK